MRRASPVTARTRCCGRWRCASPRRRSISAACGTRATGCSTARQARLRMTATMDRRRICWRSLSSLRDAARSSACSTATSGAPCRAASPRSAPSMPRALARPASPTPGTFWRNEPKRWRTNSALAKRTRGPAEIKRKWSSAYALAGYGATAFAASRAPMCGWLAEPKLAAAGPPSPFGLRRGSLLSLRERRLVPVEGVEPPCLLGDRF